MKKNKLQEYADKSLEKYDNRVLREKFVSEKVDGNERVITDTTRNWFICLAIILLCAALFLSIYMLFIKPSEEKHYLLENQQKVTVTKEELLDDISNLTVNDQYLISCQRINDISYNETLYYEITFHNDESYEELRLTIVTNVKYEHTFTHSDYNKQDDYLNIRYLEKSNEEDGLYTYDCKGEFVSNNIRYYAGYQGIGLEPQSNFIGFLQQCIEVK